MQFVYYMQVEWEFIFKNNIQKWKTCAVLEHWIECKNYIHTYPRHLWNVFCELQKRKGRQTYPEFFFMLVTGFSNPKFKNELFYDFDTLFNLYWSLMYLWYHVAPSCIFFYQRNGKWANFKLLITSSTLCNCTLLEWIILKNSFRTYNDYRILFTANIKLVWHCKINQPHWKAVILQYFDLVLATIHQSTLGEMEGIKMCILLCVLI